MCVGALPTCMCVHQVKAWCPQRSEEGPGVQMFVSHVDASELFWRPIVNSQKFLGQVALYSVEHRRLSLN